MLLVMNIALSINLAYVVEQLKHEVNDIENFFIVKFRGKFGNYKYITTQ